MSSILDLPHKIICRALSLQCAEASRKNTNSMSTS